ncbi:MAG: type II toxin-antitoxin system HicA family toxin [Methanotrichaceae archaeon]
MFCEYIHAALSNATRQLYKLTNVSWNELVKRLRKLGFEGPYLSSGPHTYFMKRGDLTVDLPNPNKDDGVGLLKKILKQAEISREEWLSVA